MEPILFWLLSFALLYLLATSFILLRNRFELIPLPPPRTQNSHTKISVCIPARNEENNISRILDSVCSQDHPHFNVHVLDDESEDSTPRILEKYRQRYPEVLSVHKGRKLPPDWLGKPWACQQLADASDGEILLFLDADTVVTPGYLNRVEQAFESSRIDMLTVWPQQIMHSFWEKTVLPVVYYALLTLVPVMYVYRKPGWMPSFIYRRLTPVLAVACGQCIAFTRTAYLKTGGHRSVKKDVVEDVGIARKARRNNLRLRMFYGADSISCRMYRSEGEIFEGLRKNLLAGLRNSIFFLAAVTLLHIIVFVLPFLTLVYAVWLFKASLLFLSAGVITLLLLHRLLISTWFRMDPLYAFTHPVAILWFLRLAMVKTVDYFKGRKSTWKGRKV